MARRGEPLHITRGESYDHLVTFRDKDTEDPLSPWPTGIASSVTRNGVTVDFDTTESEEEGTVLFSLTSGDTGDMEPGLWQGGVEVDGRTWLTFPALVSDDPTP